MITDLIIDGSGRFRLAEEELADFARYLRDSGVPCDVEEEEAFHAEGRAYGTGHLRHLYDTDEAMTLYRSWRSRDEILSASVR